MAGAAATLAGTGGGGAGCVGCLRGATTVATGASGLTVPVLEATNDVLNRFAYISLSCAVPVCRSCPINSSRLCWVVVPAAGALVAETKPGIRGLLPPLAKPGSEEPFPGLVEENLGRGVDALPTFWSVASEVKESVGFATALGKLCEEGAAVLAAASALDCGGFESGSCEKPMPAPPTCRLRPRPRPRPPPFPPLPPWRNFGLLSASSWRDRGTFWLEATRVCTSSPAKFAWFLVTNVYATPSLSPALPVRPMRWT
mmetsp:Transcript_24974/g.59430  ORF Transcript_24974/g.59430 Transcript_24974/m.59430 type:complete len:257 (+) Transcript_24974:324-1094(+)